MTNDLFREIGMRLREARKESGFSQEQVAKAVGINRVALSYYETGKRKIDLSTLKELATFYGYSLEYFTEKEKSNSEEPVMLAFRAEDLQESDLEVVAWAKNFVLSALELEKILQKGGGS